jgi:hypothetical protein
LSTARKKPRLSNDDGSNDDSSDSPEEEISSEETSMNQLDISEEKLFAKRACGSDGGDTTSPSLEPRTPESHWRFDDDNDL